MASHFYCLIQKENHPEKRKTPTRPHALLQSSTTNQGHRCEQRRFTSDCGVRLVSANRLSNITIVVVDDNIDVRRYVGAYLAHLGANVALAKSASEGLEEVKIHRPNLVISDISMPGRDGFGFLRDIRELGSEVGGNVPVIAMTALVSRLDGAQFLRAGFQAFLSKPFSPDKLVEVILAVLNG
jgi:CheY-like chemotaxis protein